VQQQEHSVLSSQSSEQEQQELSFVLLFSEPIRLLQVERLV
jgi:hypothetical protein